ncbi:alpha/beta fold hydrolase [Cryptosporangium arvum]|uniref:Putative hydrolase or acyltransferase of alpha/beta superfamily n=1 Tax=Cryptosporangium arvum DSM 44712 TaxID=927661 RepID=A0A010YV91_9ACTN|nr:alpha/beta hydrolase [Cryptosporangium arvum]EXG79073.1 putative hydrolase or acyltransferase of alpha/beta superfamily [Cryptosporangium arvum DSM 44712]
MRAKRTAILIGAAAAAVAAFYVRRQSSALADPRLDAMAPVPPRVDRTVRSADGTAIHVTEYGPADAPTVVLAHGWTCAIGFYTNQIRALSRDLHVVAYNLRGHGGSAVPGKGQFTTDALADDLAAVLHATVPDGQRAVVVGHSMGAMSLVALAGKHRALLHRKVAAAMLANTGVTDLVTSSLLLPGPDGLRRLTAPISRTLLAASLPLGTRPTAATMPLIRYIALAPQAPKDQVAFCAHIILETPRTVRGGFGATLGNLDLRTAVPHLDVPATVVTGEFDLLTPPKLGRRLAEDLPQARLVEIDGVGHMTPVEAPEIIEREIRALVDAHLTATA